MQVTHCTLCLSATGVAEVPQAAVEGVDRGQGIYTFIPYAFVRNGPRDPLLCPGSFSFPGTMGRWVS